MSKRMDENKIAEGKMMELQTNVKSINFDEGK